MGGVSAAPGRLRRKYAEAQAWLTSALGPRDWPAALVLAMFRTRPPVGDGAVARLMRRTFPRVWIRPRLLRGHAVALDPSQLAQFVIYEEVFIDRVYDLTRLAFEPDLIVDCGAFEGYFSLLARAHFPDAPIVAFEPDARNYAGLMINTGRGDLRIDARAAAVSTADGEGAFAGGGCGGRLADATPNAVRVPIRDLRGVLRELRPARLLLKLDIEGEEARLLPALLPWLPRQSAMFLEWHQGPDAFAALREQLTADGFATSVVRQHDLGGDVFIDAFAQRT